MTASPSFAINGGGALADTSVSSGGAVSATLVSTDGVRSVAWSISKTDETTSPASYTLTPSGALGQTVGTTALTAGTAATLKCIINGGIDPATDKPSTAMTATAKFFVPTSAGLEVLTANEFGDANVESSLTHGAVKPVNNAVRFLGAPTSLAFGSFISIGASPFASTGLVRVPKNNNIVVARNSTDSGDITAVAVDGSNNVVIGATAAQTRQAAVVLAMATNEVQCDGTNGARMMVNGTTRVHANGTGIGFFNVAPTAQSAAYSITNPTTDRALNVTADTLAQGLAVLGTLIQDLKDKGLIG